MVKTPHVPNPIQSNLNYHHRYYYDDAGQIFMPALVALGIFSWARAARWLIRLRLRPVGDRGSEPAVCGWPAVCHAACPRADPWAGRLHGPATCPGELPLQLSLVNLQCRRCRAQVQRVQGAHGFTLKFHGSAVLPGIADTMSTCRYWKANGRVAAWRCVWGEWGRGVILP